MDLSLRPEHREVLQRRLEEMVWPAGPDLRVLLAPLLRRPAKRLRPTLLLAVADLDSTAPDGLSADAVTCAAAVELLHQSSLVHDDLMDDATSRAGLPALHREYGIGLALVAGDFLLAAAGSALCEVDVLAAAAGQVAYREMCRGQALETLHRFQLVEIARYAEVVSGKSAALLQAACVLGAHCAGFSAQAVSAYGEYGLAFGMLFQIADDLVDLLSTPDLAGKPVGQDVTNGVFTLPVLMAAQIYGRSFTGCLPPSGDLRRVREFASREAVLAEVMAYAVGYADRACRSLQSTAEGRNRTWLATLPYAFLSQSLPARIAPPYRDRVCSLLAARG